LLHTSMALFHAFASQVHLSLTEDYTQMLVTWSTTSPSRSEVIYGQAANWPHLDHRAHGVMHKLVDNGTLHHTQYIHRVVLTGLESGQKYSYRVWNDTQWGTPYGFTAVRHPKDGVLRYTVYGDFGLTNAVSFPSLVKEAEMGVSDIIVHVGDFAYDMWRFNSTWGDLWFDFMQPIMATQPYMVCPGNHEGLYDFLNYRNRFSMPGWDMPQQNLYHSWTGGLVHWISYSTEVYFVYEALTGHGGVGRNFGPYPKIAEEQLAFVEADLQAATANRNNVPWIIAYGHRPMYCSDNDDSDCTQMNDGWKGDLEALFYKYGVDIVIEGHEHSYERLWPVFNGTVFNGSTEYPYTNPGAPIHLVSGSAGCDEDLDTFNGPLGSWSAVRISEYGYAHLTAYNASHLHWEQLDGTSYEVYDEIWVIKDSVTPKWLT